MMKLLEYIYFWNKTQITVISICNLFKDATSVTSYIVPSSRVLRE